MPTLRSFFSIHVPFGGRDFLEKSRELGIGKLVTQTHREEVAVAAVVVVPVRVGRVEVAAVRVGTAALLPRPHIEVVRRR